MQIFACRQNVDRSTKLILFGQWRSPGHAGNLGKFATILFCLTFIACPCQVADDDFHLQEPLITSAEAKARLTDAVLPPPISTLTRAQGTSQNSLAVVPLPEGFELSPFSPDVRWRKDRNARKLSSGATAIVYRYILLDLNNGLIGVCTVTLVCRACECCRVSHHAASTEWLTCTALYDYPHFEMLLCST